MTQRVLKWHVPVDDQIHPIGTGPVLHVDNQLDTHTLTVWTEESDEPHGGEARAVRVFGTGQPLPNFATHLGSVLVASGALVWHLYELAPAPKPLAEFKDTGDETVTRA